MLIKNISKKLKTLIWVIHYFITKLKKNKSSQGAALIFHDKKLKRAL